MPAQGFGGPALTATQLHGGLRLGLMREPSAQSSGRLTRTQCGAGPQPRGGVHGSSHRRCTGRPRAASDVRTLCVGSFACRGGRPRCCRFPRFTDEEAEAGGKGTRSGPRGR